MASTYSTNLAIELIGTGDQAGAWGNTTNTNLGTLIEQAISGYVTQAVSTGTDTTITIPNGATGVARNMYIELTGTGGASTNLIVPANKKLYFIFNNTSSGQVTVKVSGQTGVSVPNKAKMILVSNGTDIVDATNYIGNISAASANITVLTSASATITNLLATSLTVSSGSTLNGGVVINEPGADVDFRVEGDTDANLIFADASTDRVGVGTGTPGSKLEVKGAFSKNTGDETTWGIRSTDTTAMAAGVGGGLIFTGLYTTGGAGAPFAAIAGAKENSTSGNLLGQLRFYTTDGSGINQQRAVIDSSGNLGIGTSSPGAPLHVAGAISSNPTGSGFLAGLESNFGVAQLNGSAGGVLDFSVSGTDARGRIIYTNSTNAMGFGTTDGTVKMTLDSSGNLGLGVTPASWGGGFKALQIVGGSIAYTGSGANEFAFTSNAIYDATDGRWEYRSTGDKATRYSQDAQGVHYWYVNNTAGTAGNPITWTQAMTLDASGNLGVGISPTTRLHVSTSAQAIGSFNSTAANGGYLAFATSSTEIGYIGTSVTLGSGANNDLGVRSQNNLMFYTNGGNERARITSGGYFKASDAGTYVGSTGTYHELRNTANETAALFSCSNTGFTSSVMSSTAYPVSGTGFKHLICRSDNGNDEVMNIRGDGNLYNDNGVYGSISDQRLKQDIADAPSQWNDIKAVRFRKFRMKDDVARDENAPYLLGVVAQELEQVSPGLVDDGEVKTVKSSILLMKAAVALQEAMARIEQLETKVAALESK